MEVGSVQRLFCGFFAGQSELGWTRRNTRKTRKVEGVGLNRRAAAHVRFSGFKNKVVVWTRLFLGPNSPPPPPQFLCFSVCTLGRPFFGIYCASGRATVSRRALWSLWSLWSVDGCPVGKAAAFSLAEWGQLWPRQRWVGADCLIMGWKTHPPAPPVLLVSLFISTGQCILIQHCWTRHCC